jgi:hypothetical protein
MAATTCAGILAALFEHGPLRWSELCAYVDLDDDSRSSAAWEPLEHLMELGLVRQAFGSGTDNFQRYRATHWRHQPRKKAA